MNLIDPPKKCNGVNGQNDGKAAKKRAESSPAPLFPLKKNRSPLQRGVHGRSIACAQVGLKEV